MTLEPYWTNGHQTLYHGDTLHVLADLRDAGITIDHLATDPPYSSGGQFRGDRTGRTTDKYVWTSTQAHRPEFTGDNRDQRAYLAWCSLWLSAILPMSAPGAIAALFTDWRQLPTTTDALQAGGWVWRGLAPWDKGGGCRPTMRGYAAQCEYVVWGTNGPANPDARPVCVRGVFPAPIVRDRAHIAQKPLTVMHDVLALCPPRVPTIAADHERHIDGAPLPGTSTRPGLVLDPFLGSGTTLVAAHDLGLDGIGIDTDEHSLEVAARRLEDYADRFELGHVRPAGLLGRADVDRAAPAPDPLPWPDPLAEPADG